MIFKTKLTRVVVSGLMAVVILFVFNPANSRPDPHLNLLEEYTFDVFCKANGNIALVAKKSPENLDVILEGVSGKGFSDTHNMWIQSVVDFGRHSLLPDDKLFASVYEYCLKSKTAKSVYIGTLPPSLRKEIML